MGIIPLASPYSPAQRVLSAPGGRKKAAWPLIALHPTCASLCEWAIFAK
jgi:hypothetical protein